METPSPPPCGSASRENRSRPRCHAGSQAGEVGGVVLYSRNIESPAQVRELCREIRSAAGRGNPLPLIAVDQEGGRVARLKDPPFTWFPPARACSLFCCRNETVAEAVGAATAAELRAVGIDVNFAPVLDVDSNPAQPGDRGPRLLRRPAHRGRPRDRVREGIALPGDPPGRETFPGPRGHVRRLPQRAAGRPGGKANAPSPRTAPLPPRRARGNPGAHDRPRDVPVRSTAPCRPPCPGRSFTTCCGNGLRFRGAVISDALEMKAIADRFGIGEAAVLAVTAGCDVVLVCRGESAQAESDRPAGPGDPGPRYVPAGGGGGGGSVGAASGVGGVERTLSAGAAGGGGGAASTAVFPSAGGLGKYRANISGR